MVVIRFVITKDGTITKSEIFRDIGADCGKEALRVINSMPNWIPGRQLGVPVNVEFRMPIKFVLDKKGRAPKKDKKKKTD